MPLMDRGYPSDDFLRDMLRKNSHSVLRCRNGMTRHCCPAEVLTESTCLQEVQVRCVRFALDSGETETLLTSTGK